MTNVVGLWPVYSKERVVGENGAYAYRDARCRREHNNFNNTQLESCRADSFRAYN